MVITMAKLRMAHASTHGARKPPGPIKTYLQLVKYGRVCKGTNNNCNGNIFTVKMLQELKDQANIVSNIRFFYQVFKNLLLDGLHLVEGFYP